MLGFSHDPIFNLQDPISVPESFLEGVPTENEFSIKVIFQVKGESQL